MRATFASYAQPSPCAMVNTVQGSKRGPSLCVLMLRFCPTPQRGIHKSAQGIALGANPSITQVQALKGRNNSVEPRSKRSSDGLFTSITTSRGSSDCSALSGHPEGVA